MGQGTAMQARTPCALPVVLLLLLVPHRVSSCPGSRRQLRDGMALPAGHPALPANVAPNNATANATANVPAPARNTSWQHPTPEEEAEIRHQIRHILENPEPWWSDAGLSRVLGGGNS